MAAVSRVPGTVTSVGLAAPPWLSVSGSPVTTAGTLAFTGATQPPSLFLASPSGSSGVLAPRSIGGARPAGANGIGFGRCRKHRCCRASMARRHFDGRRSACLATVMRRPVGCGDIVLYGYDKCRQLNVRHLTGRAAAGQFDRQHDLFRKQHLFGNVDLERLALCAHPNDYGGGASGRVDGNGLFDHRRQNRAGPDHHQLHLRSRLRPSGQGWGGQ